MQGMSKVKEYFSIFGVFFPDCRAGTGGGWDAAAAV